MANCTSVISARRNSGNGSVSGSTGASTHWARHHTLAPSAKRHSRRPLHESATLQSLTSTVLVTRLDRVDSVKLETRTTSNTTACTITTAVCSLHCGGRAVASADLEGQVDTNARSGSFSEIKIQLFYYFKGINLSQKRVIIWPLKRAFQYQVFVCSQCVLKIDSILMVDEMYQKEFHI